MKFVEALILLYTPHEGKSLWIYPLNSVKLEVVVLLVSY
jgi:hypothetical protein